MILETGRIVSIEPQGMWVETIQRSACGSCRAQKGCGHSLLSTFGTSASQLWVLSEEHEINCYRVGDSVQIGVPEDLIAQSALLIYLTPVFTMLIATALVYWQGLSEGASVIGAVCGLIVGAFIVRCYAYQMRFDKRLQPVLVCDHQPLQFLGKDI